MTYLPHWRATFRGGFRTATTGDFYEQWNTSIAINPGTIRDWGTDAEDVANDLWDDFAVLVTNLGMYWTQNTVFRDVRLDAIGVDGRITQDAVFSDSGRPDVYGEGLPVLPPQCATVLTLDTKVRGRSRFGRMFLPLLGQTVGADGVTPGPRAQAVLDDCLTFINSVGNTPGVDLNFAPVVASGVGSGSLHEVKEIRVGRAIDTMRSRRRSLDEDYLVAAVTV